MAAEAPQGPLPLPTMLPLNQQLEVRGPGEDWTGLTDSAQRRKLQNRLHQRAWRRRQARQAKGKTPDGRVMQISREHGVPGRVEPRGESTSSTSSSQVSTTGMSICSMRTSSVTEMLMQLKESFYQQYLLGSPRVDLLLTLVKFNVFQALVDNTRALGFGLEWLEADAISPFNRPGPSSVSIGEENPAMSPCLQYLRPTTLQRTVEHHPWIDLFPIPRMRDNILRTGESFDEDAMCHDLVELCASPGEQSGLLVWGNPWDPGNWEVGEHFLKAWSWAIEGCWDLFHSTNYWRSLRGEEKLFPDTIYAARGSL